MSGTLVTAIERHPYTWRFKFSDSIDLNIECHWRLFEKGNLKLCDADHEQKFGLTEPIDAITAALKILGENRVLNLELGQATSDLDLRFENDIRLQLLQKSTGYESWNVSGPNHFLWVE